MGPLVSAVIATHNREKLLPEAVKSIQEQTYSNFEIIIVDDASQDDTPAVIERLIENDPRIRFIHSDKNIGPGAARNLGIAVARGEYVAIMDDDDLSEPYRLELEIEAFRKNPDAKLVFSSVSWVDDSLNTTNVFPGIVANGLFPSDPKDVFRLLYMEGNKIPNTTITFRRELGNDFRYPENPWIGEDWFLCMQFAASGGKMKVISEPLVRQRRGQDRQGLMAGSTKVVFRAQREVLLMIRHWLRHEGIIEFDSLYKRAIANQILRESRHFVGIKGIVMVFQSFLLWPTNPKVKKQIGWYLNKLGSKLACKRSMGKKDTDALTN